MALKRNDDIVLPLMALNEATPTTVSGMVQHVPEYAPRDWRRLVENTVGAIHQIPRILKKSNMPDLDLKDIEEYFGRSSAGAEILGHNLYGRFRSGLVREYELGMVFAKTTILASRNFERFGISLIDQLKKMNGLCISNRTFASSGSVGVTESGFLYMTFRLKRGREHAQQLSQKEINYGVQEVLKDLASKLDGGGQEYPPRDCSGRIYARE